MAIRRGVVYRVPTFRRAFGLLVLTNDDWNEAPTLDLAGALTYPEAGPGRTEIPRTGVWAGPLLAIPKADLADALVEFGAAQLGPVEAALLESLALRELLSTPPRAPQGLPGVIDYPRWSQIYYAADPVGDPPEERKRYVAVSHDAHNRALGGAIFVRTTTSARRGGRGIPALRDGAKAVCVLATFISSQSVRMRRSDQRPDPAQLFLVDMAMVAAGLVDAFELADALSSDPQRA